MGVYNDSNSRLRVVQDQLADQITFALSNNETSLHAIANLVRTQFALMSGDAAASDTKKLSDLIKKLEEINGDLVNTYKGAKAIGFLVSNVIFSTAQAGIGIGMGLGGLGVPALATAGTTVSQGLGVVPGVTTNFKEFVITGEQTGLNGKKTITDAERDETRNSKEGKNSNKTKIFEEIRNALRESSQAFLAMLRG